MGCPTGGGGSDDSGEDLGDGETEEELSLTAPIAAAAAAGPDSIILAWSEVSGAEGYYVYRCETSDGDYSMMVGLICPTTMIYTDPGLSAETTYYYVVAAYRNSDGEGPRSDVCWATTTSGYDLPAPTIASVAPDGAGTLRISWSEVSEAAYYNLYRDISSAGTFATLVAGLYASIDYTDSGLTAGTTYYYKVQASDGLRTSLKSDPVWGTTLVPPSMPTGLSASEGTSASSVSLSWTAVSGADGYNVYRYQSFDSAFSATQINGGMVTANSFSDTGALYGYDYYYYVTAKGPGGESAKSAGSMGYKKMPMPTGLTASTSFSGYVYVSWTAASRINQYKIYRDGVYVGTSLISSYTDYPGNTSNHTYQVTALGNNIYDRPASESAKSASATGRAN